MVLAGQVWSGAEGYRRDAALPTIHYVGREWTWPKRGQRFVRWARWLTLRRLARSVERVAREEACDAIVSIFPNEFYLYAGYEAARRLKLPYYPYFHNTYLENRRGLPLRFARWLERRVFEDAPVVFVMSEGMKEYYEPRYPGVQFEPLVHTFNEPIPDFASPPAPGSPIGLAFIGNLNESNVDAARRMAQMVNQREDCRLTTYSGTPDWYFAKTGVCGSRIKHTRVAYDEVTQALRSHDILLFPHGFTGGTSEAEYATIFPTRTIASLLAARPILAHTPPGSFLTRWLRNHDCAEIVDTPDVQALSAALDRLRDGAARREELVRNALVAVRQFHAPAVAANLRRILAETGGPRIDGGRPEPSSAKRTVAPELPAATGARSRDG